MAHKEVGIIVNGVTGRMGYRQHLVRSLLAIRDDGGVELADGSRVQIRPILVGRNAEKVSAIADRHQLPDWTTDLDAALADPAVDIYFDSQLTSARVPAVKKAIAAGKHIYAEKPIAETSEECQELIELADRAGVKNGVVHDKLYLPGLRKLRRLIDSGFFGRIFAIRGEFGYWVFEGDWVPAQRPSWNYRAEDGGGIVSDMFPHWNYVLENLFGTVQSVYAQAVTHIDQRVDEQGRPYTGTADDAAYAIFELEGGVIAQMNSSWEVRVHRKEMVEFQVDGTQGSAVVGLFGAEVQPRVTTPRPSWNPDVPNEHDFLADWHEVPETTEFGNGFRAQWEDFIRHVVEDGPHPYDFRSGARGVRLAELAWQSSTTGQRVAVPGPDQAAAPTSVAVGVQ